MDNVAPSADQHPCLFVVPTPLNPNFQGRVRELKTVDDLLKDRKKYGGSTLCPVVALHGLGGVGYALRLFVNAQLVC